MYLQNWLTVTNKFLSIKYLRSFFLKNHWRSWYLYVWWGWIPDFRPMYLNTETLNYSTGVQIVSCTLSDDSVLSGTYLTRYSVSANEICFDKKSATQAVSFKSGLAWKRMIPPPPGDYNRPFECLFEELFKIWHWNLLNFLKWHQSGP